MCDEEKDIVKQMAEAIQETYVVIKFDVGVLDQRKEIGQLDGSAGGARYGYGEVNVRAPCQTNRHRWTWLWDSRCPTLWLV
jgi:hypothetical protein